MDLPEKRRRQRFILQWHVTGKCDMNCAHCYRFTDTFRQEAENELGYEDCIKVLDDLSDTMQTLGLTCRINFSGGDPLLRGDFFDLIKYARKKDIAVGILGNPTHVDFETAGKLKEAGVMRYQVSIDGMEETHDMLRRKKGSFQDALRAIDVLEKAKIRSVVMFTLSKTNAKDLIEVIKMVAGRCSFFDFSRMVPIGHGEDLKDQMFKPEEYRKILLEVFELYKSLSGENCKTRFGRKEPLWALLEYELGVLKDLPGNKKLIYGGCSVGMNELSILADGTVYACRRLPLEIGRVPEQKISDIFLESEKLNEMRDVDKIEKCMGCEITQFCRGCRAVSYAVCGDYFGRDPQCWKGLV